MRLSLRTLSTFALLGVAAAVPAFAQSSDAVTQYPTCAGKPAQADTEAAHGAYMAGKGSFDEADYTTAINYFKDAYRRDCTKTELLAIIARAYELQGNRREAVHALETYLDRMPNAPDAEVQKRHIANLKREIAEQAPSATASAPAAPSASASAAPVPSASVAPPVSPAPSASASAPPAQPSSGHSVVPWIFVGAGGVALITGGILFGVGSGQVSSAQGVCGSSHACIGNTPANTSAVSQGNSGRTNETVGAVVGGVGIAAVAAGLIWHFVEGSGASDQPPPAQARRPEVTPQVGPGYAGVGVGGRF